MRCHSVSARINWREQIAARGYDISLLDHPPHWIEAYDDPFCAVFSRHEIDNIINRATQELTKLALELVEEVCCSGGSESYFDRLQIAPPFREPIRRSWKRHDQSLYGRFDFSLNGDSLKLLELNLDTPTSLYESAQLQRMWLEEMRQFQEIPFAAMQSNSIQEKLIGCLRLHFSSHEIFHLGTFQHAREEIDNIKYVQSCADMAGLKTQFIYLDEVRYDPEGVPLDREGRRITCLFKLFPWELLFIEDAKSHAENGKYLFSPLVTSNRTTFIEPAWKSILSSKSVLPLLWDFTEQREFLLNPAFDVGSDAATYRDFHLVIGSWVVGDEPAGVSVRADSNKATRRQALFVPHYVTD
ncbi:MAG: glutathionylspermidine synthase family protein [Candidatus Obscuribacterales bacterium]